MKKLAIIVAANPDDVIGKDGKVPWHIPEDMKRFKELTMGRPVIMGRKTFESLPDFARPLPGRCNIVCTRADSVTRSFPIVVDWEERDFRYKPTDKAIAGGASTVLVDSFENALRHAYELHEEPFVIGGADIYKLAFPLATRVEATVVQMKVENADTFLSSDSWSPELFSAEFGSAREHEGIIYYFVTATRKEL